ncbi:hypothetical protein H9X85_02290 [Anaerotignum lactatifermentans]|uniref:Uncharacterized protein n=1 Tax=Anaerotignum lactatifermentans TaxID=160404 RepID=A0ABS2GBF3_9FIRM|nr:hypothetical protein [Anaerotignum lactatifermentans]MBM6828461.1 hypothetical protein [Anaerotignum lactatifermentans]MBM6877868.1 hypothetical protein [Anaerotignum lactatifermentans]MBM6950044.1 hypothetical protein [Anaerotignum lactatifermentans]
MAGFEIAREDTLVKVESAVGTGDDQLFYGTDGTVHGKENAVIRSMGFDKIAECASSYKISKIFPCEIRSGFFLDGNYAYILGFYLQKLNLTNGSIEACSKFSFSISDNSFVELVFDSNYVYVINYNYKNLIVYKLDINTLNLVSQSATKSSLPEAAGLKVLFDGNYIAVCIKNAIYVYDTASMENVYSYTDEGLGNCGGVPFFTEDKTKIYFIKNVISGSLNQFYLCRASFPYLSDVTQGAKLFQLSTTNEINFVQSYYNNNYAFFIYRETDKIDTSRVQIYFIDMRKSFTSVSAYSTYCYTAYGRSYEKILFANENQIILKTDSEQGDIIYLYNYFYNTSTNYISYEIRRLCLNESFDALFDGTLWIGNNNNNKGLRSGCIANLSWEE